MTTATEPLPHLFDVPGVHTMRDYYRVVSVYASSTVGDVALIRAHIAYHSGRIIEGRCSIRPSRGYSYRVAPDGTHGKDDIIVRVVNVYDHRDGVTGWQFP